MFLRVSVQLFLFAFMVGSAFGNPPWIRKSSSKNITLVRVATEFSQKCYDDSTSVRRVFGGREAREGEFPYMVFSMYVPSKIISLGFIMCSGALISTKWTLLAAHCFCEYEACIPDPESGFLVAGKADLSDYFGKRGEMDFLEDYKDNFIQEMRPISIEVHHGYKRTEYRIVNDIAMVLTKPFKIGPAVRPIEIAREEIQDPSCRIQGWGGTEYDKMSPILLTSHFNVKLTNQDSCEINFICGEDHSNFACGGDSGAPLVCNKKTWGIMSFQKETNEQLMYFTEIYGFLNWINDRLDESNIGEGGKGTGAMLYIPWLLLVVTYRLVTVCN